MELKALRLFVILADELHFGRAAQRAGVTQSVLSVQIKRLEDVLAVELFKRSTREVRLTEVGVSFREDAEGILRRVDEAAQSARARASGSGRLLRLGLTSAVEVSRVMDRIADFRMENPDVQVTIRELGTVDQEAALAGGDIDLGVLHPPLVQEEIIIQRIHVERLKICFNPLFFSVRKRMSWSEIFALPIVFFPRKRAPRMYDELIVRAGSVDRTALIVAEAGSFFEAAAMAHAGLGIGLLPPQITNLYQGLQTRELPTGSDLVLETAVAVHRSLATDPAVQAFYKALVGRETS